MDILFRFWKKWIKVTRHSLTADCDNLSIEENVTVVIPVASALVDMTGSEAMLALSLRTLLLKCLVKRLGRQTLG